MIGHIRKIMLRVTLNRLKKKAEDHLAEEQSGFRAGSTVEQKHLHQTSLFHNFVVFKKVLDRVWHDGSWQVLRRFGMEKGPIQTTQALYNTSGSAVLLNN